MFQHEVSVEQDCFDFRKKRIIPIDVRPARLHHRDLRIHKVMDGPERRFSGGVKSASKIAMTPPSLFSFLPEGRPP